MSTFLKASWDCGVNFSSLMFIPLLYIHRTDKLVQSCNQKKKETE